MLTIVVHSAFKPYINEHVTQIKTNTGRTGKSVKSFNTDEITILLDSKQITTRPLRESVLLRILKQSDVKFTARNQKLKIFEYLYKKDQFSNNFDKKTFKI